MLVVHPHTHKVCLSLNPRVGTLTTTTELDVGETSVNLEVPPSPSVESDSSEQCEVGIPVPGDHNDTVSMGSTNYSSAKDHVGPNTDNDIIESTPDLDLGHVSPDIIHEWACL